MEFFTGTTQLLNQHGNTITLGLGLWGAGLSTALALSQGFKAFNNRARIYHTWVFASSPAVGNRITITNHSATPITVVNWEIVRRKRNWRGVEEKGIVSSEFDWGHKVIDPHQPWTLHFIYASYFSTAIKHTKRHGRLYLKINILGRGTVIKPLF